MKMIRYTSVKYILGLFMQKKIGQFKSSIAPLELNERTLYKNTLILAEEGSGKTHLANVIREFVIDSGVPTLYLDFSNPDVDAVEERFKSSGRFFYMQFEENEAFNAELQEAIDRKENIYMAVDPSFFTNKRDVKSEISKMLQKRGLLDNYYYIFHEIAQLDAFYTKFEDFLLYTLNLINLQKYGLTFLTQPHETFEDPQLKLLFTFLYLGKCSNANYYNTSMLKNLKPNSFHFQFRTDYRSLMFNPVKSDIVFIDA